LRPNAGGKPPRRRHQPLRPRLPRSLPQKSQQLKNQQQRNQQLKNQPLKNQPPKSARYRWA
jgi:hypothetical protein